jgi:hypothetical protein
MDASYKEEPTPMWRVCEHGECQTLFDTAIEPSPEAGWAVMVGLDGNRRLQFKGTKFTQLEMDKAKGRDDVYVFCRKCYLVIYAEILGNKFLSKEILNSLVKTPHGDEGLT